MQQTDAFSSELSVRTRLSTLWVALLFNMAFADIVGFAYPGTLAELMRAGTEGVAFVGADGVVITPGLLLVAAVFIEIAILMIYLSRVLGRVPNRIANLVAAVMTAVFIIGGGSAQLHYIFFASIEIAILVGIVILVWGWSSDD